MLGPQEMTLLMRGLIGGSVSMWGWGGLLGVLCVSYAQHGSFLLPVNQDIKLSASPVPCLPVGCLTSCRDSNGLNLRTVVMVSLHGNKTLTKSEAGTRDWGSAVIGLTMLLLEERGFGTLN